MLFIKGMIIGLGKIIPGVSGSMLAISMGVYDTLIHSVNTFFKDIKNNFSFLLKIGLGIILSIILFSNIILNCLNKYYIITIFFFAGLILGSLSSFKNEVVKKKAIIIISFFLMLLLGFFTYNNEITISDIKILYIYFFISGFIDAITMVIPGISGTAVLMMFGTYDEVVLSLSRLLDLSELANNIKILLPFSLGLFVGVIVTVKIVDYLFRKQKMTIYNIILGIGYSNVVLMLFRCINTNYNFISLVLAYLFLLGGYKISRKL